MKRIAIYARVSTTDQSTESQLLDLRRYVSERGWNIFKEFVDEGISGTKDNRPALNDLMNDAKKRRFDVVLVWRFDRFARSTKHLILALEEFKNLGIDFVSYQENIDTSSPLGSAIFTIISAVAQLERDIIAERVKAGLRRAKENGKRLGRPQVEVDLEQVKALRTKGYSTRAIAEELGLTKSTAANLVKNMQLSRRGIAVPDVMSYLPGSICLPVKDTDALAASTYTFTSSPSERLSLVSAPGVCPLTRYHQVFRVRCNVESCSFKKILVPSASRLSSSNGRLAR